MTAAESRKKSKAEALLLKDEVQRLSVELKTKNDVLQEFKDKLEMYEQGTPKSEIEQIISQRRVIAAAAAVITTSAVEPPVRSNDTSEVSLGGLVAVAHANALNDVHVNPGQIAEL